MRIKQELRERGVPEGVVEVCLEELDYDWQNFIAGVREKKFGKKPPGDYKEQAKTRSTAAFFCQVSNLLPSPLCLIQSGF